MKITKSLREIYSGDMLLREFEAELNRALAAHPGQHFAIDLFDVLRTALFVLISLPVYMVASIAFAAATYIRLAGVLLAERAGGPKRAAPMSHARFLQAVVVEIFCDAGVTHRPRVVSAIHSACR